MQSRQIATFAWSKNRRIINMLALLLDDHLKEEACMKYINARNILPDALVKELQQRNRQIVAEFQNGTSMEELAEKYFLSVYAIRKIIYQK